MRRIRIVRNGLIKLKIVELLESNTHYQSLLQIQKGSITEYENSLKQEKSLTNQLQLKIEYLQRLNGELEQNLRVRLLSFLHL